MSSRCNSAPLSLRLLIFAITASLLAASCAVPSVDPGDEAAPGLEPFADAFFGDSDAGRMNELRIPGLVLVAVQDGEVLLAKGYGQASIEEDLPVDPQNTAFRIGSVSKLFVAVAVMQLVESAQLDLHTDVNQYLDSFQVQNPFPEPVTLESLLSHSSGIQDPPYETTTDPAERLPLQQYLISELGPATTRPGEQFHYSSSGYALAAYLVERASGLPFDQYMTVNVLEPLGMDNTLYLLSPSQASGLATGYVSTQRGYEPQPLDYDDDYPGGSLISTAHDMSLFMRAILGGGCAAGRCVLKPETLADMQRPRIKVPSGTLQQALGFVVGEINGQRVLGHTGAILGFGSSLDLYPDHNLGTFIAFNAECYQSSACSIVSDFRQAFVSHQWPRQASG